MVEARLRAIGNTRAATREKDRVTPAKANASTFLTPPKSAAAKRRKVYIKSVLVRSKIASAILTPRAACTGNARFRKRALWLRTNTLAKLRISIVQYLNTAPLVWGFTNCSLHGKYELSFTVPSQCAEALRSGAADVAIIPAIANQRIAHFVVLPG